MLSLFFSTLLSSLLVGVLSSGDGQPERTQVCSHQDLKALSCTNPSLYVDRCCVNAPGLILHTQFYSWKGGYGPKNWTIHGLWPDHCDGSYSESCDTSREYTDIVGLMLNHSGVSALTEMSHVWLNDPAVTGVEGGPEDLWAHEWAKHGTCMSTLKPSCYTGYERGFEAVEYFEQTVALYESRPTFDYLAKCGIVPTNATTYALDDIEACLEQATGALPHVACAGDDLREVWYYYFVRGPIKGGKYVPTSNTFVSSTCPDAVRYPPAQP